MFVADMVWPISSRYGYSVWPIWFLLVADIVLLWPIWFVADMVAPRFFHTKRHGNISTDSTGPPHPLTGPSNAGGVGTSRDSGRVAYSLTGYRSMVECERRIRRRPYAVYRTAHRRRRISESLCITACAACTTTTKGSEHSRIYLYAAVNLKCK